MVITEELLLEVEQLAYNYMTIEEIAIIIGLADFYLKAAETPLNNAFKKGRLMRKAKFHESICRLTDQCSSPAMAIELKLAESLRISDSKI